MMKCIAHDAEDCLLCVIEHYVSHQDGRDMDALWNRVNREMFEQLTTERAKREEAERNYYTLCDAVCRESKGVEDAKFQYERFDAICRVVSAAHQSCREVDGFGDSAALMAEVERMRELGVELVERFQTVLDNCAKYVDVAPGRERLREYLAALSQSPTEKKT